MAKKENNRVYEEYLQDDLGYPYRGVDQKAEEVDEKVRVSSGEPGLDEGEHEYVRGVHHEERLREDARKSATDRHRCKSDKCIDTIDK